MDPLEGQFEPELKPAYFDPDALDMSEQQFAASLEAEIEKPAFVVDDEDPAKEIPVADGLLPTPSNCGDSRPRLSDRAELDDPVSEGDPLNTSGNTDCAPDWRDQVSAKVNKYKSSKAPKVRYPSLQLQFDPPAPRRRWGIDIEPDLPVETPMRDVEIPQARQVPQAFVSLEATARILEFPRSVPPPVIQDELAEPMLDRPRIVEAPALLPPPPASTMETGAASYSNTGGDLVARIPVCVPGFYRNHAGAASGSPRRNSLRRHTSFAKPAALARTGIVALLRLTRSWVRLVFPGRRSALLARSH